MNPDASSSNVRRRAIIAAVAVLAVGIAGAAFVFGRGSSATTPQQGFNGGGPPPLQGRGGSGFQQFQACLEKNGLTLTPGQRPDLNDPVAQKAFDACRSLLPSRGPRGGAGPGSGRGSDDFDDGPPPSLRPQNGQSVAPGGTQ